MQIAIQVGKTDKPKVFNIPKAKVKALLLFAKQLDEEDVDENSKDYKDFFENEVKKAMKTKRVKSGNSLREII